VPVGQPAALAVVRDVVPSSCPHPKTGNGQFAGDVEWPVSAQDVEHRCIDQDRVDKDRLVQCEHVLKEMGENNMPPGCRELLRLDEP
jgi:hypothetical protein